MQLQLVHSRRSAAYVHASPSSLPLCVLQDDPLKTKMQGFLLSSTSQQEVATLDQKVCVRDAGQHVLGANSVQCVIATFHVSLSLMCTKTGIDSTALYVVGALYWVCTVHVVCAHLSLPRFWKQLSRLTPLSCRGSSTLDLLKTRRSSSTSG